MRREIKEAAVYAVVGLVVLLLAAWNFWLRQAALGVLVLVVGWGCLAVNSFLLGARYGLNRAFDRDWEDPEAPRRRKVPAEDFRCPGCGCTEFTWAAGAHICICCGAVITGNKEADRHGESKV